MKKKISIFLYLALWFLCYPIEMQGNIRCKNLRLYDSTYFSFSSSCNIELKILHKRNAILNINGKTKKGIISINRYSKDFFDFKDNTNNILVTFSFENSNIAIENQKYQFECEDAKFIVLYKIKNDNESLIRIKEYLNDNQTIFDDNIESLNDKAFFLEKNKQFKSSAFILEKITLKRPDRVVAWLNLGDVYWEINKINESRMAYLKYIELMKSQNKDLNKIPNRVYERSK